ncbi:hypothetical protein QVD17_18458 [Tagetes erecta]|uniref:Uncharacterized protein n=1 Tax=Tagetes erecta TaxID=13708 RepID=A0AAD8KHY5_TARER|nr:hypothetical protein QVD17_18458 [Tagetes erecta]
MIFTGIKGNTLDLEAFETSYSLSIRFYKTSKMNHCGIRQKNTFASSPDEMRSMVCPKPRRLSHFTTAFNEPVRPLRWQMSYPSEYHESYHDSKTGAELLDTIFSKGGGYGGYGASEQICTQVASSPPFFSGSPPSRVSNPLIQDARFGDDNVSPLSPRSMVPNPASSGLQIRSSFGNKPAVRVEGFDCLDRDNRRNCSILTRA